MEKVIGSTGRMDSLRRRATAPRLTVVLAVEGASEYALRAIESVQAQDIHDLQFVIVKGDATPGVAHELKTVADRDIHVDVVESPDAGLSACFERGFAESRGRYVAFMRDFDWFAPKALDRCLKLALDREADIVFPSVSFDRYDIHHERHSRMVGEDSFIHSGRDELRDGLCDLIASGRIAQSMGAMFKRSTLDVLGASSTAPSQLSLVARAYSISQTVCADDKAIFHTSAAAIAESFDPAMFNRACADANALRDLLDAFALDVSSDAGRACETAFFGALVACIENLCLSPHSISSIERNARLKDMLDASRTREMVEALNSHRRDLGLMFQPIASAKPLSCIIRSHVADFLNLSMNKTA